MCAHATRTPTPTFCRPDNVRLRPHGRIMVSERPCPLRPVLGPSGKGRARRRLPPFARPRREVTTSDATDTEGRPRGDAQRLCHFTRDSLTSCWKGGRKGHCLGSLPHLKEREGESLSDRLGARTQAHSTPKQQRPVSRPSRPPGGPALPSLPRPGLSPQRPALGCPPKHAQSGTKRPLGP